MTSKNQATVKICGSIWSQFHRVFFVTSLLSSLLFVQYIQHINKTNVSLYIYIHIYIYMIKYVHIYIYIYIYMYVHRERFRSSLFSARSGPYLRPTVASSPSAFHLPSPCQASEAPAQRRRSARKWSGSHADRGDVVVIFFWRDFHVDSLMWFHGWKLWIALSSGNFCCYDSPRLNNGLERYADDFSAENKGFSVANCTKLPEGTCLKSKGLQVRKELWFGPEVIVPTNSPGLFRSS